MVVYSEYTQIKILYHHRHQTFMLLNTFVLDMATVDLPAFFLQTD